MAVLVVVVGLWFGGPPVAEQVVKTGLAAGGLRSDDLAVDVQADPPLELALGRAGRVVVTGTDVDWNGHHADTLRVTLDDVDLLGRSAARTSGRLDGIALRGVEPRGSTATAIIAGQGPTVDVTITIDASTAEAIASAAFEGTTGTRPTSVTLEEPNVIRFKVGPVDAMG